MMQFFKRTDVFLGLTLLLALDLYWPSVWGLPVWDDINLWFHDPTMRGDFSYLTFWERYAWPLTLTYQKLSYDLAGTNYAVYHLVNLLLHFVNSLLLFFLCRSFALPYPRVIYLIFLLHPANVISVAWMSQTKTLLAFLFAITSFLALWRARYQSSFLALAILLFFLGAMSKSSILPFTLVLVVLGWVWLSPRLRPWLLSFVLIGSWSGYRLLTSELTRSTIETIKVEEPVEIIEEEEEEELGSSAAVQRQEKKSSVEDALGTVPTTTELARGDAASADAQVKSKTWFELAPLIVLKTTRYYFWQLVLPLKNHPVKGVPKAGVEVVDVLHVLFLGGLVYFLWGSVQLYWLAGFYIMLSPFLGIIPAPYMNLTWVSDQHLYLAMPPGLVFLALLIKSWEVPRRVAGTALVVVLLGFAYNTSVAVRYYLHELSFFQAIVKEDPTNVGIVFNLAVTHLRMGNKAAAADLLEKTLLLSDLWPTMRESIYFPHLKNLAAALAEIEGD